jgi:hypothetical protein
VETNDGVEHDDGENGDRIDHLTERATNDACADEYPNDEVLELAEKDRPGTDRLGLTQFVSAVFGQALCRFRSGKPAAGDPK